MKYSEREKIIERLPYEARLGFVAFCVERCLEEARRHDAARQQLERLPLLQEGLDMLWRRAERGEVPDAGRVEAVRAHLSGYETPDPDGENVNYRYDATLVDAASELRGGLRLAQDPNASEPEDVAGALEGPVKSVGGVYDDWQGARRAELEVIDAALLRLKKWGSKPFSRAVFEGIPEWKRGKLSKKYAEGRLTGTDVNRDE